MTTDTYRRFDPWRPSPVREEARKQIMSSMYFNVDRVSFDSYDVGHFERYIVEENNGDTVGVLALTDDGRIPFIEQYRIPTHRWTLEIPAGHARSRTERPLDVAKRKLRDEAGFEAENFSQFTRFINTPSFSNQHTTLFYATGLKRAEQEKIDEVSTHSNLRFFTPDEAYEMVVNGSIIDAKSILAVTRLRFAPETLQDPSVDTLVN